MPTVTPLVAPAMGFAVYVVTGWALLTQLAGGGVPVLARAAERPPSTAHRGTDVMLAISSRDDTRTLVCATTADLVSADVLVVDEVEVPMMYRELGCTPAPALPDALGGVAP